MKRIALIGVLLIVLLIAGSMLVDKLVVTEEERLLEVLDNLGDALEREDASAMQALLVEGFTYSGPRPIDEGDLDGAMAGLAEYWEATNDTGWVRRQPEIEMAAHVAVIKSEGVLRFKWGDSMAIYRVGMDIGFQKRKADGDGDGAWKARSIAVTRLQPGIL